MKFKPDTLGSSLEDIIHRYESGRLFFVRPEWAYEVARKILGERKPQLKFKSRFQKRQE